MSSGRISEKSVSAALVRNPSYQQFSSWVGEWTHQLDDFCVGEIISDDFTHFWEMPAVPFLDSHRVSIELFIQIIQ